MKTWGIFLFVFIVAFDGFSKGKVQLQRSNEGYTIDFNLSTWSLNQVDTLGVSTLDDSEANAEYTQILVPDYEGFVTEAVGMPEVPILDFIMVIGDKETPPEFEFKEVVEADQILDKHIFPAQIPWPKSIPLEERPFSIDANYYSSNGVKSPLIKVVDVFTIRDVPCARIHISPFFYNPQAKSLSMVTKATIIIKTKIQPKGTLDSKSFESMIRSLTENYEDFYALNTQAGKENYLIITADKFEPAIEDFKKFREKKYNVKVVKYSDAGGKNSTVMDFIKKEYQNVETKPTFALIVGDHKTIPGFKSGKTPTDRPYSSLSTSTMTPKVHVGRFAVNSATEIENIVKKTIYMEEGFSKTTMAKRAVFIGGVDKKSGKIAEKSHNYVIDTYLKKEGWESIKFYANSDKSVKKSDWSKAINEGANYNFYSAHGGVTSWSVGGSFGKIYGKDYKALKNTSAYPHSAAFACYTGNYQNSRTCIAAQSINEIKGAVTCFGSTVSSTWGPDDRFQRKMFDAMYKNKVKNIGASFDAGAVGSGSKKYLAQYVFFGDPALLAVYTSEVTAVDKSATSFSSFDNHIVFKGLSNNHISFSLNKPSTYTVSLHNINGRLLYTHKQSFIQPGSYTLTLGNVHIPPGMYLIRFKNDIHSFEKKLATFK